MYIHKTSSHFLSRAKSAAFYATITKLSQSTIQLNVINHGPCFWNWFWNEYVTRSREMSHLSKIPISSFLHHFLKTQKCFILMQTPLQLDIWLQSYEGFDTAKNDMKQRNFNTVFCHYLQHNIPDIRLIPLDHVTYLFQNSNPELWHDSFIEIVQIKSYTPFTHDKSHTKLESSSQSRLLFQFRWVFCLHWKPNSTSIARN